MELVPGRLAPPIEKKEGCEEEKIDRMDEEYMERSGQQNCVLGRIAPPVRGMETSIATTT